MRWHTAATRLAAGAASLLLLSACSGGASPSSTVTSRPSDVPASAPTALTPAPSVAPTPAPTPSTAPAQAWHEVGTIATPGEHITGLVGFDKGYVAAARWSPTVWFSADGRTWDEVALPFPATKDRYDRPLEALVNGLATNGRQVLAVGGYSHEPCNAPENASTGGGPDCLRFPLAWITDDGVTWTSAYPGPQPDDPPGYDQGSEFVTAWSLPAGGWEATLSSWDGELLAGRDVWQSDDGIAWTLGGVTPSLDAEGTSRLPWAQAAAADVNGRRILWQRWAGENPLTTLAASEDGRAWTRVEGFPGERTEVHDGVAPGGTLGAWVLAGGSSGEEWYVGSSVPTVWTSDDGDHWTTTVLPTTASPQPPEEEHGQQASAVARTEAGYLVVAPSGHKEVPHESWLSEDGLAWVELPPVTTPASRFGPGVVADGPAGIIGIGASPTDKGETATVWTLR